jgi:hypothetical protein
MPSYGDIFLPIVPSVAIYFTVMRKPSGFLGILFAVLCLAPGTSAQTRSDYLLITDPSQYSISNEYQQPLSAEEQRRYLPGSPLRIIEKEVIMGDQISRSLKFSYLFETGYLLKDEKGDFTGENHRSNRQNLNGCETLDDTVEMVKDGLRITSVQGNNRTLKTGERLLRVFRSNGRYYVFTLDAGNALFGWTSLEPKSSWKKSGKSFALAGGSDTLFPKALQDRLTKRIEQANRSYEEMFSHFNGLTGDEKSIPRWQGASAPGSMTFTLSGPWVNTDELLFSTRYLQRDLETMLLGSGFWLTGENGKILINRNSAEK